MSEPAARGYRGYIASRPVRGLHIPQRLQNLLIRDYAGRHGYRYLLSATEHVMPASYMVLESVLDEIATLEGLIAFSLFMLPRRRERRLRVYERILTAGAQFHAALENLSIASDADIPRCEDVYAVATALPAAPFAASMERLNEPPNEVLRAAL